MTLPVPRLDDRRFQDLVDEAKRMVMQRCPEWTDHNVSDPGVTLIETFAYMTDVLLYRLNRIPERLYVKFLELIGVTLYPPVPARAPVTFWLSAPAATPMTIEEGTEVATIGTESADPIVFSTVRDLSVVPAQLQSVHSKPASGDGEMTDRTDQLRLGVPCPAFAEPPRADDALMIALAEPVPACAVQVDVLCTVEGLGVDPSRPPLVWEAWDGDGWAECAVSRDETGGFNRSGAIVIHVPGSHAAGIIEAERGGWLRARVLAGETGRPVYSASPMLHGLSVGTVGGTVDTVNAEPVTGEVLGESEGVAGQRFTVNRTPVLAGTTDVVLEVSSEDGWDQWSEVTHFADSGPEDRHFLLDPVAGVVRFGPLLRQQDGTVCQFGAVPKSGSTIRMVRYTTGGGRQGNVVAGAIQSLTSSIPFVAAVENRVPALGGVDGETVEQAKLRGPQVLRSRDRAVTTEDYEVLAAAAAPELARVRCLAPAGADEAGAVRLLLVPAAPNPEGRLRFEDLVPARDTVDRLVRKLDEVRVAGVRVVVEPPLYKGITVVARIVTFPQADADRVRDEALTELYAFLNPLSGGPDGRGWPFGRRVQPGEVFSVLQRMREVDLVTEVRLFGANPVTGARGSEVTWLDLEPNSLVFSYEHQVKVEER